MPISSAQSPTTSSGTSEHRLDPYSIAHLSEAKVRIAKALDAQYIYNLDDIRINLAIPRFFMEPDAQEGGDR